MYIFIRRYPWCIPAIILLTLLILGARAHALWGDEAETGIFGRNILSYGIPKGWDGVNLMGFDDGVTINSNLIENSNPWPQYYLTALSFKLLGISSFTARIPFVLFGVGSLIALWYLIRGLTEDRNFATLTAVKVSLNVALILYLYQARYFSLVFFFGLLFLWGALSLPAKRDARWVWLCVISGILGIYSQPITFAILMPAVVLGALWSAWRHDSGKKNFGSTFFRFVIIGVSVAAAYVPWVYLMHPFDGRGYVIMPPAGEMLPALWSIVSYFGARLNETNTLPILLLPVVIWYFAGRDTNAKRRSFMSSASVIVIAYIFIAVVLDLVIASDSPTTAIRYHVIIFPMLTAITVGALHSLWERHRWVGALLFLTYVTTSVLTVAAPSVRIADYLTEMLSPYTAPDEAVAAYLSAHAKPGDSAYVSLDRDHEPLVFLLNKQIRFVNRIPVDSGKFFPKNFGILPTYIYHYIGAPKWIILYGKLTDQTTFETFDNIPPPIGVDLKNLSSLYDETVLPVYFSDKTRPELNLHSFTRIVPKPDEQIFIYQRRQKQSSK